MFHNVEAVSFDDRGNLLLHSSRPSPWKLERDMVQLICKCPSVSVSSGLMFEHTWHDPSSDAQASGILQQMNLLASVPYPKVKSKPYHQDTTAYGNMLLGGERVFAFKNQEFLGEILKFECRIVSGSEHYCSSLIYEDVLSVTCVLEETDFSRLFKHVFLSGADWEMGLTIGIIGFQWRPEAAFGEVGDTHHLVIEADRQISSELRSIRVAKVAAGAQSV